MRSAILSDLGGEDIETAITPDLYDALYEQVKARVLAYIPELADHKDKLMAMLLIKAGMWETDW